MWAWDVALKKCCRTRGSGEPAVPNRPVRLSSSGATTWSGHGEHTAPRDGASPPLVYNLARSIHRAVAPGRPAPVTPESGGGSGDGAGAGPPARAPGRALNSMLLPELQRVAQSLGITGVGRMRKSQLIEAIQSRQGGPAAGPARSAAASAALDHSATRGTPARAGAPRYRGQDA